jgi:hypothetical protein
MTRRVLCGLLVFCLLSPEFSFAQQMVFAPRESVMFATLKTLQEREEAMRVSLKQAQSRGIQGRAAANKNKEGVLAGIASRTHAYLNTDIQNNSNVDSAATNRKSSVISEITPGLKANFSRKNASFLLNAYTRGLYSNNRARSNVLEANLDTLASFSLGRYSIFLSNDYFNNYLAKPHFNIKKDGYTHYWKDTITLDAGSHFNRYDFDVSLLWESARHDTDYSLASDYDEQEFRLNQYFAFTPKTQFSLEYVRNRVKNVYKDTQALNDNSNEYIVGLAHVWSYKTSSSVTVDYKSVDYKVASDTRDIISRGAFTYRLSERSNLSLSLERTMHDSKLPSSNSLEDNFIAVIYHRFSFNPKLSASFTYDADYYDYIKTDPVQRASIRNYYFSLNYAYKKWLDLELGYQHGSSYYNYKPKYEADIITFKSQARF